MMCFRDRWFCSASDRCSDKGCNRNYNSEQQARAKQWWKGMGGEPPIAFSPAPECPEWTEAET